MHLKIVQMNIILHTSLVLILDCAGHYCSLNRNCGHGKALFARQKIFWGNGPHIEHLAQTFPLMIIKGDVGT